MNINGSSANITNPYQMNIIINYGGGTDGTPTNNVYCDSNCKIDFSDIRFTDSSGNLLYYWIYPSFISRSKCYSMDKDTIYSSKWGPDTFLFFDNFSRGNYSGWTVVGGKILGLINTTIYGQQRLLVEKPHFVGKEITLI